MAVRRSVYAVLATAFALAFAGAFVDLTRLHSWPGWDDGWVLLAFPLGVPAAVAVGLRAGRDVAAITLAVWGWAGLVFLVWLALA